MWYLIIRIKLPHFTPDTLILMSLLAWCIALVARVGALAARLFHLLQHLALAGNQHLVCPPLIVPLEVGRPAAGVPRKHAC